ncbi:MAG: hypothetical protein F4087_12245 [Gemmatimonadetes bacterium]|nr:hypothetical protein [Gemmatimonadota bacterium]MYJ69263.1 hypothetical protein [Gemmatimonadota bacterium]
MKRLVRIDARYYGAAKRIADSVDLRPSDVIHISVEHHVEMLQTIERAGLGDSFMTAGEVPALFVQAVNLLAARATQRKRVET